MPPELLYYPYNPVPPTMLLMANVMSFHHTATLLRGGGIFCYLQVFWEIFECSKSLVIDFIIALYAKF